MKFFHRFEVWLLVALSVGAAVWVFTNRPAIEGNPETIEPSAPPEPPIKILRTTLERDYGNARLDIELRYRNASPRALSLQPPDARLLAADGKEVPPFVLPIEKPAEIAAQTAQDVRLRYWLDQAQLQGTLTLDIRGDKAEVKSAAPLNLEKLDNRKSKTWSGPVKAD